MTDITDYLMKEALKADAKADEYAERLTGVDSYENRLIEQKVNFHRGQASGFRQATFVVVQFVGTPAHD